MSWVTKSPVSPSSRRIAPRRCWSSSRVSGSRAAKGLVQEQALGPRGQGPRQPHPLLLAAGELGGPAVSELLRVQLHQLQQGVHPLCDLAGGPAQQARRDPHVLRHVQVGEETDLLEAVAELAAQRVARKRPGVLAVDPDAAGVGLEQPVHQAQQGGLPRSRAAHQHHQLAGRQLQGDFVHGHVVPEAAGERAQRNHVRSATQSLAYLSRT